MEHVDGTVAVFQAMAPVLIANVLTVTFVYCRSKADIARHLRLPIRAISGRRCSAALS